MRALALDRGTYTFLLCRKRLVPSSFDVSSNGSALRSGIRCSEQPTIKEEKEEEREKERGDEGEKDEKRTSRPPRKLSSSILLRYRTTTGPRRPTEYEGYDGALHRPPGHRVPQHFSRSLGDQLNCYHPCQRLWLAPFFGSLIPWFPPGHLLSRLSTHPFLFFSLVVRNRH